MHILRCLTLLMLLGWCCLPTTLIQAKETAVRVGQGSFTTVLPAGAKEPQAEIYRTEHVRGPMPTNDWWSSLAWVPYSDRQFPHPLAVQAGPSGLHIHYPGTAIVVHDKVIYGTMPHRGGDILLGHAAGRVPRRSGRRLQRLVRLGLVRGRHHRMRVSYGHGSPFVYAVC